MTIDEAAIENINANNWNHDRISGDTPTIIGIKYPKMADKMLRIAEILEW